MRKKRYRAVIISLVSRKRYLMGKKKKKTTKQRGSDAFSIEVRLKISEIIVTEENVV